MEQSGTCVGVRCAGGVVLAAEKLVASRLLVAGSGRRSHHVGRRHALCVAGLSADGRQLVPRARDEAASWRALYGADVPTRVLAERLASYMHQHTLFAWMRPFGAAVLLAGWDEAHGHQLFALDTAGTCHGYRAAALGKAASAARNEVEKLDFDALSVDQALLEAAKAVHRVHDDIKDKLWELELCVISDASGHVNELVTGQRLADIDKQARAAVSEDYDSE